MASSWTRHGRRFLKRVASDGAAANSERNPLRLTGIYRCWCAFLQGCQGHLANLRLLPGLLAMADPVAVCI